MIIFSLYLGNTFWNIAISQSCYSDCGVCKKSWLSATQTIRPSDGLCISLTTSPCLLTGMPDFLEKLHMATLKAKNMEIKVKDYISTKPLEMSSEAKATAQSPERKNEGSCGPARIEYA